MNDDEFIRRRKQRALVTAILLFGLAFLFYFITIARLGSVPA